MSFRLHNKVRLFAAACLLLGTVSLASLPLRAQDTPTEPPLIPTETIEAPTEPVPAQDAVVLPTEDPTAVATDEPTALPTEDPVVIVTDEPTALPTEDVIVVPETPAVTWLLAYGSAFETGVPAELGSGTGWLSVDVDGGRALQSDVSAAPLTLSEPLLNSAVQVRAWINAGTLVLTLREQGAGSYRATIDASGAVSLTRGTLSLANVVVEQAVGAWHTWRLEAFNGTVTLSLDGIVVLAADDASPLGAGLASVSTAANSVLRLDDLTVYADVPVVITPVVVTPVTATPTPETPVESALPSAPPPGAPSGLPMGPITCPPSTEIAMVSVNGTTQGNNAPNFSGAYLNLPIDSQTALALSDDGRYVVYTSYATNLVAGDTNNQMDIFRFDRTNCTSIRVSLQDNETQFTTAFDRFSVSDDGNLVVFGALGFSGFYLRNISAGTTTFFNPANAAIPSISGNGQYIAFLTSSSLVAADTNNQYDVYRLQVSNPTNYVQVTLSDADASMPNTAGLSFVDTVPPGISDDGNIIIWASTGKYGFTLTDNTCDMNYNGVADEKCFDVFVRNISAGTTQIASVNNSGATGAAGGMPLFNHHTALSGNGRYVAFNSTAVLSANDTDTEMDVYVRDMQLGTTTLVSLNAADQNDSAPSAIYHNSISDDGNRVVFISTSTNLVTGITPPGTLQGYVRDLSLGENALLSANAAGAYGTAASFPNMFLMSISGDGTAAAFGANHSNLVPNDTVVNCDANGGYPIANDSDCFDPFWAPINLGPGPLTAPTVSASTGETGQITLQLGGLGTGTEYRIERNDGANFAQIGTTANSFFVDNNAGASFACGVSKSYRVRVYRSSDQALSDYSTTANGSTVLCAPTITAPVNNFVSTQASVDITWPTVPGATSYTLERAKDAAFTTDVQQFTGVITVPYALSSLSEGTYFVRVRAVGASTSAYSPTVSFKVDVPLVAAPVLSAPPALTNDSTPLISWNAVAEAGGYRVEIRTTSTPITVPVVTFEVTDLNVDDTDWDAQSLPNDGTYYVTIATYNRVDERGPFGTARAFMLDSTPLAAPTGLTPNSATVPVPTLRPAFKWVGVTGAASTILQIDADGTFDSGANSDAGDVYNISLGAMAAYTLAPAYAPLNQNQVYFWRVVVLDTAGNRSASAPAQMIALLGSTPATGTISLNGLPAFTWTAVAGAAGFNVQIDDDATFGSPTTLNPNQLPGTAVGFTRTAPAIAPGYYVWRVMPVGGVYGNTLTPRTLIVTPNAKPVITGPAANAALKDTTQTITWTDSNAPLAGTEAIRQYKVEVKFGSTVTVYTTTRASAGDPLSYQIPVPLTPDGVYTVRMAPIFDPIAPNLPEIVGTYSTSVSFTIDTEDPAEPVLVAPLDDAIVSIRPTFKWNAVAGAVKYRLEVDADGNFNTSPQTYIINAPAVTYAIPASAYLRQGPWSWRVIALDAAGNESPASDPRGFHANASTLPANGAFGVTARPTLTWAAVNGATGYILEVNPDAGFIGTPILQVTLGPVTSYIIPANQPLALNTQFFWRVVPMGVSGDAVDTVISFVTATAPATPTISSPTLPLTTWAESFNITASSVIKDIANADEVYRIEIARDAAFVMLERVYEDTTPTLLSSTYLLNPGVHYVRAQACYRSGAVHLCSPYSLAKTFTIVPLPFVQPLSPVGTAVPQINRPTFSWAAVTGAVRYRLTIDNTSDFSSPLYDNETIKTNSFTLPATTAPLPQGDLFWRVIVIDVLGTTSQSAPVLFRVSMATAPADESVVTTLRPTFTWKPTAGATSYTFQIDTNTAFSSVDYSYTGSALTYVLPVGQTLADDTLYFWRVTPNTQTTLLPSGVLTFITQVDPLDKPVLTPANSTMTELVMDWDDLSSVGALTLLDYQVEIGRNATFTQIYTRTSVTTSDADFTVQNPQDGVYYVHVRARYQAGSEQIYGPYSDTRIYTKDTTAPAAPVISLPAANAVLTTLRPTITWAAVTGATSYRLDMFTDNGSVINNAVVNTTSFIPANPLPQEQVYVRVRAVDSMGNTSGNSALRTFRVFIGKAPLDAAITIDTTPTFTWTVQPGITNYIVQVDAAGDFSAPDYTYPATLGTFTPITPLPVGAYLWRVVDAADTSTGGLARLIIISPTAALPAPTGLTPIGPINNATPTLAWTGVTLPGMTITYELQVASAATFAPAALLVNQTGLAAPTFTPASALTQGLKYARARVKYEAVTGQTFYSAYTPVVSFTVDTAAPAAPLLMAPIQYANLTTTGTPAFTWSGVAGVAGYRVEIDGDSDVGSPFYSVNVVTASHVLPGASALANGTYYWHVIARDAAGNETASAIRTFTVARP